MCLLCPSWENKLLHRLRQAGLHVLFLGCMDKTPFTVFGDLMNFIYPFYFTYV